MSDWRSKAGTGEGDAGARNFLEKHSKSNHPHLSAKEQAQLDRAQDDMKANFENELAKQAAKLYPISDKDIVESASSKNTSTDTSPQKSEGNGGGDAGARNYLEHAHAKKAAQDTLSHLSIKEQAERDRASDALKAKFESELAAKAAKLYPLEAKDIPATQEAQQVQDTKADSAPFALIPVQPEAYRIANLKRGPNGLGVTITADDPCGDYAEIVAVATGGPNDGYVSAGDKIYAINKTKVKGLPSDDVFKALRTDGDVEVILNDNLAELPPLDNVPIDATAMALREALAKQSTHKDDPDYDPVEAAVEAAAGISADEKEEGDSPAQRRWSKHQDDTGKFYYYNKETRESVWEKPEDFKEDLDESYVDIVGVEDTEPVTSRAFPAMAAVIPVARTQNDDDDDDTDDWDDDNKEEEDEEQRISGTRPAVVIGSSTGAFSKVQSEEEQPVTEEVKAAAVAPVVVAAAKDESDDDDEEKRKKIAAISAAIGGTAAAGAYVATKEDDDEVKPVEEEWPPAPEPEPAGAPPVAAASTFNKQSSFIVQEPIEPKTDDDDSDKVKAAAAAGGAAVVGAAAVAAAALKSEPEKPKYIDPPPKDHATELARRFAPVLMFDRGEQFYPTDANLFMKHGERSRHETRIKCCDRCCVALGCESSCLRYACWKRKKPAPDSSEHNLHVTKAGWEDSPKKGCGQCCTQCLKSTFCLPSLCCVDCWVKKSPQQPKLNKIYYDVAATDTYYTIQYWMFFEYTSFSCPVGWCGNHEGGWEHMTVLVDKHREHAQSVYYGAHSDEEGRWFKAHNLKMKDGTHPPCYVAKGSHALYGKMGTTCFGCGVVPRVCCCNNDVFRRSCAAETWTYAGIAGEGTYGLHRLSEAENNDITEFGGRWGWWLPTKGPVGLAANQTYTDGEEGHLSTNWCSRMFAKPLWFCCPTHGTPLTTQELRQRSTVHAPVDRNWEPAAPITTQPSSGNSSSKNNARTYV